MSETTSGSDLMADLAGIAPGGSVAAARALRPDVVRFTQSFDTAVFEPKNKAGLTRGERAAVALRIAQLLADEKLSAHYRQRLATLDAGGDLAAATTGNVSAPSGRWQAILAHVDRLTQEPSASNAGHLSQLTAAGLSRQAIVALSELIAYINYQSRVRAGLVAIGPANAKTNGSSDLPATHQMHDFTGGELEWEPWLTPVDLERATEEQLQAMKITPSNRAVGAYTLVLAHDPETLAERSPLYNAIMFGPRGLPRADRELGAVVASRINGCAYCAAVHAKRFVELAKEPDVMQRLHRDGLVAALDPRRAAIVRYSALLTASPSSLGPNDAAPLRTIGLGDGEILDLTYAVSMFAWANRLMQSLGTYNA